MEMRGRRQLPAKKRGGPVCLFTSGSGPGPGLVREGDG